MAGLKFKVTVTGLVVVRPDLGVDLAVTTTWFRTQLLISRTVSPFETAVLSITHLDVGLNLNVLQNQAILKGTRSFNPSVQRDLKAHFILSFDTLQKSLEVDVAFE